MGDAETGVRATGPTLHCRESGYNKSHPRAAREGRTRAVLEGVSSVGNGIERSRRKLAIAALLGAT